MLKLGEAYCIRFMQRGKILSTSQKRGSALALPMTLQNGRKDILVSLVRCVFTSYLSRLKIDRFYRPRQTELITMIYRNWINVF